MRGLDLTVNDDESLVLIGRSGTGKSVTLKSIIGLLKPDKGEVLIDGENIVSMKEKKLIPFRRKMGMLFQNAALFDSMSVEENVAFSLREDRRMKDKEIKEKVAEALEAVDLAGQQSKMPAELSGGMKKRVGLARAVIGHPKIMLYDEPTAGLDPIVADSINKLIVRVCEKYKVTAITVTHDMTSAYAIADRIAMLYNGQIYFQGTPEEIQKSSDPIIYDFVNGISRDLPVLEL